MCWRVRPGVRDRGIGTEQQRAARDRRFRTSVAAQSAISKTALQATQKAACLVGVRSFAPHDAADAKDPVIACEVTYEADAKPAPRPSTPILRSRPLACLLPSRGQTSTFATAFGCDRPSSDRESNAKIDRHGVPATHCAHESENEVVSIFSVRSSMHVALALMAAERPSWQPRRVEAGGSAVRGAAAAMQRASCG